MIRFHHVYREYRNGLALDDVNIEVRKGEFCFLTGHSGAGKSTLLRMVHMADRPTRGEVRVSGYSSAKVKSRDIALLRRKIGYIFQTFASCRTVTSQPTSRLLEVTGANRSLIRTKVGRLLAHVGLAAKAEALPRELSGGEQQRIAVARALVHDPLVLLADEPTGNLDERSTMGILRFIRSINAAGTAVLLPHTTSSSYGRVQTYGLIELDHGKVVYDSGATE
jgi:cell division transport system ATP-binding protein